MCINYLSKCKRKIKYNNFIKYIRKIIRKIKSNTKLKYSILTILLLIIAYFLIFPTSSTVIQNETFFVTCANFKFKDYGVLITAVIGILGFIGTLYTLETNYKTSKLTALPDNSVDLLIELEYYFNEYEVNKNNGDEDIICLFIDILKYWKKHQKAFRLLCPNFYKKFLKLHSTLQPIEKKEIPQTNSEYIIKAMKNQIFDVAFGNTEKFYFIKPNLIKDDKYISNLNYPSEKSYRHYNMTKNELKNYINRIDTETKLYCNLKFDDFCIELDNLLFDLKEEIRSYESLSMW